MRTILLALLVAGCSKTDPLYCGMHRDDVAQCGAIDASTPVDTTTTSDGPSSFCVGATGSKWEVCVPIPTGPVSLPGQLDTTNDSSCLTIQPATWMASGQPEACVIVGTTITMGASTTVFGTRPLVLVAQTIDISGTLDVASHVATPNRQGPGVGNATQCAGGTSAPVIGGGGAGGSFSTIGGGGGITGGIANTAGTATDLVNPTLLVGGCAGTAGGGQTGAPGAGGGAVYLAAQTSITINGAIDASGAGAGANVAGPSPRVAGGSGAGSGGMVVLVAPSFIGSGSIYANGGGGACGADGNNMAGAAGLDPVGATPAALACTAGGTHGGPGNLANGNGGMGVNGTSGKTGGGGGGGAGRVSSNGPLGSITVSPVQTNLP